MGNYLDKTGLTYFWGKLKGYFQPKLVSGTNIKTINNNSLLGSGNIDIQSGGGSYTATSPIAIDANDDISHENSGVVAGEYSAWGATSKSDGWFIPKFTVDNKGHITSASNVSIMIPLISSSAGSSYSGGLMSSDSMLASVRNPSWHYNSYTVSAGQTSASFSISDTYGMYGFTGYCRVIGVTAIDASTKESLMVDWRVSSHAGSGKGVTLYISLAEAHDNNIYIFPLVSYSSYSM